MSKSRHEIGGETVTEDDMIYFLNWIIDYCSDKMATSFEKLSNILKESKIALKEIEDAKRKN